MSTPTATAQLRVDWTRCDGHGLCQALLPERVGLDEWGFPVIHDAAVGPDDLREGRGGGACPAVGLSLATPSR